MISTMRGGGDGDVAGTEAVDSMEKLAPWFDSSHRKAYTSNEHLEAIVNEGAEPLMPFRANTTALVC
jgi:hypothetical protein